MFPFLHIPAWVEVDAVGGLFATTNDCDRTKSSSLSATGTDGDVGDRGNAVGVCLDDADDGGL